MSLLPGLTPEECRNLLLSVGTHRGTRRLEPCEVADLFQRALESGATKADCARFVQLQGTTMISRFLKLLRLTPEIRYLIEFGQSPGVLSFACAIRLAELHRSDQAVAVSETLAHSLNKEEVGQVVELRKRSDRPIKDCFAEVVGMRRTVVKQFLFIGSVTSENIRKVIQHLHQTERDALLNRAVATVYGNDGSIIAKLGVDRFTLMTDEYGAPAISASGDRDFEARINEALAEIAES